MTPLQYRILEISYKHKLSHLGSCLGAVGIIDHIYFLRRPDEPFILSAGHCGLALYTILEKYEGKNAEDLLERHGIHPNKNLNDGLYFSSGHLGHGIGVAVGRALANRNRNVWCLISDGECASGCLYESLSYAGRAHLDNLKVFCHSNGWGAYRKSDPLVETALSWLFPITFMGRVPDELGFPFLKGLDAHYYQMTEDDWKWVEAHKP